MARRRNNRSSLPGVNDIENFLDNLTNSVEDLGSVIVDWLRAVVDWLRRHKKLALTVLLLVIAYKYINGKPNEERSRRRREDEEEDE